MNFGDTLDVILEEEVTCEPLHRAIGILHQLNAAKQSICDLQHQLSSIKNRINADIAIQIRKRMPSMNVGLYRNGSCKVGYRAKHLILSPDIENGIWIVRSRNNNFSNKFKKTRKKHLHIGDNVGDFIDAIIGHFVDHYKTLGEDIIGTGVVLIENENATLRDIVKWRENLDAPLNSRLVRLARKQCQDS